MKKYFLILFSFVLFMSYNNVFAVDSCSTSEMKRLRELANNVEFKTSYEITADVDNENLEESIILLDYSIEVINSSSDLKILYSSSFNDEKIEIKGNQNKINNFSEKEKITFYIYSYTSNLCTDELLKKVTIDLPLYNDYYYFNKEKCNMHPDFKYCKEFMDIGGKSFSEIQEEFDDYLKEDIIDDIVESDNFIWYIVIAISLLVGIVVIVLIKKVSSKEEKI